MRTLQQLESQEEVEVEQTFAQPQEAQGSSLVNSIKDAATRYDNGRPAVIHSLAGLVSTAAWDTEENRTLIEIFGSSTNNVVVGL